eukprot:m.400920 g.400920  ORF g.400920 m.400920 type:complete len:211 (+) comp56439_c0_seq64:42-674(+)
MRWPYWNLNSTIRRKKMATTYVERDLMQVPADLPVPVDDGATSHLPGLTLPHVSLPSTAGGLVDIAAVAGWAVFFFYPRTGRPGEPPLVEDWEMIPGARGCTPQSCSYRDRFSEFQKHKATVFGVSTQSTEYQQELVSRMHLPFAVLSDENFQLTSALKLPTFEAAGLTLIKRMSLIVHDGVVRHVNYPVFPSSSDGPQVVAWLNEHASS